MVVFRSRRRDASRLYNVAEIAFAVGSADGYKIHALAGVIPRLQTGRGDAIFVFIEVGHGNRCNLNRH